jgi:hypothetical protein
LLSTGELDLAHQLHFDDFRAGAQMATNDTVLLRPLEPADRADVLALLATSLREDNDSLFESRFAWKHEQNVFGRSAMLVATDGDAIVGFRAFMRWRRVPPTVRATRSTAGRSTGS